MRWWGLECFGFFFLSTADIRKLTFLLQTVGREILLHLIEHLVTSYGRDPAITRLLNNTRIHIMPTMNPDGFEATVVPDCYYSRGRYGWLRWVGVGKGNGRGVIIGVSKEAESY